MATELRIGLRFRRSEAKHLRKIGEEAQRCGVGDVGLFFAAADSAQIGEPLVVRCSARNEVEQMAALFTALGCRTPAIEQLNG